MADFSLPHCNHWLKPSDNMITFMGFDFGEKKIGIAIGQRQTQQANPLMVLKAKSGQPDWQLLAHQIQTWQPDGLVVGFSLHVDGSLSAMAERTLRFANRLYGRFNKPWFATNEHLTSFEAYCLHWQYQSKPRQKLDDLAAAIILNQWLKAHPL